MKLAAIIACHCGESAAAEADLKPLRQFGPPASDLIAPMPYPAINTLNDAGYPKGAFNYWKSAFLNEPSDAALDIMVQAIQRSPSPMSGLGIVPYQGAVTRVVSVNEVCPATPFLGTYEGVAVSCWQPTEDIALGIGYRVQRVRRGQLEQFEIGGLGHGTPRQLRSPRSASRIRDLIVDRLADKRCDTSA